MSHFKSPYLGSVPTRGQVKTEGPISARLQLRLRLFQMFLGQKCSFFRLELIISDSHLTPFVLTLSRTRKNTNCKTHKKITKKYKSNEDGHVLYHVGKYRNQDKNQIHVYSFLFVIRVNNRQLIRLKS